MTGRSARPATRPRAEGPGAAEDPFAGISFASIDVSGTRARVIGRRARKARRRDARRGRRRRPLRLLLYPLLVLLYAALLRC